MVYESWNVCEGHEGWSRRGRVVEVVHGANACKRRRRSRCCWFRVARYATLEGNLKKRKGHLSDEENIKAFNSFTPGYPYMPEADVAACIPDTCPNKAKVIGRHAIMPPSCIPSTGW